MISLASASAAVTIALPEDLMWSDEFNWTSISQQQDLALNGALLLQESRQLAGRPITLQGGDDFAWIDRATLLNLQALAETPNTPLTLTMNDGSTYTVVFSRIGTSTGSTSGQTSPITAKPVQDFSTPGAGDFYSISISLMVTG